MDNRAGVVRSLPVRPSAVRGITAPRLVRLPHLSRAAHIRASRGALALAAMVITALVLFVSTELTKSTKSTRVLSRQTASSGVIRRRAAHSVRTAQTPKVDWDQFAFVSASQKILLAAIKSYVTVPLRTRATERLIQKSRRTSHTIHRTVKTASKASSRPVSTDATEVEASADKTPVSESPSTASSSVQSDQSSSTSSSGPPSTASGPTGLGAAVGQQCNPQCSG